MHDLDTFPGFLFSPKVLGHPQIVGYRISPFLAKFGHLFAITFISQLPKVHLQCYFLFAYRSFQKKIFFLSQFLSPLYNFLGFSPFVRSGSVRSVFPCPLLLRLLLIEKYPFHF